MRIAKTLMSFILLVCCLLGQDPRTAGRQDGIAALGQGVYKSMREAEVRKQKKEIQKNLKALEAGNLVECTACTGTGYVNCDACSGLGYEGCSLCSGQGSVGYGATAVRCTVCNGNGKSMHDPCKGTGREACSRCDGTGNLGEAQKQSSNARAAKAQPQEKQPSSGGGGTATAEDLFLARRYEEAADLAKKKLLFEPKNTALKIIYFYSLLSLGELDAAKTFVQQNRQTTDKYLNATLPKMESDIGVYEGLFNVERLVKESFEKFNPAYMERAIEIPTLTDLQRLILKCNLNILKGDFEQAKKDCETIKEIDLSLSKSILNFINDKESNFIQMYSDINNYKFSLYTVLEGPQHAIDIDKSHIYQTKLIKYFNWEEYIIKKTPKASEPEKRVHNNILNLKNFNIINNISKISKAASIAPFNKAVVDGMIYSLIFEEDGSKFLKFAQKILNFSEINIPCYDNLSFSTLTIDKKAKIIKYKKLNKLLPEMYGTFGSIKGAGVPFKLVMPSSDFQLSFNEINVIEQSAKNKPLGAFDTLKGDSYLFKFNSNEKYIVPSYIGMRTVHYQYGAKMQKLATRNIGLLMQSLCSTNTISKLENPDVIEDGSNGFTNFMAALGDVASLGMLSSGKASAAQQEQARSIRNIIDQDNARKMDKATEDRISFENNIEFNIIGYGNTVVSKKDEIGLRALATYKYR